MRKDRENALVCAKNWTFNIKGLSSVSNPNPRKLRAGYKERFIKRKSQRHPGKRR